MTARGTMRWVGVLFAIGLLLCVGPWYKSFGSTALLAATKLGGLIWAGFAAVGVSRQRDTDETQRRPWRNLGLGLLFMAGGQSVLAYHQVILHVGTPFPSVGDPLFVAGALLAVAAFIEFVRVVKRSGLPLGDGFAFWWPALVVVGVLLVAGVPLLRPIVIAGGSPAELFLNIYYPSASFVTLVPLAIMLRIGLRFRGGRLLAVWAPLSLGFAFVLISDVLFAYFSMMNVPAVEPVMDLLYASGYVLVAFGATVQYRLLRS